MILRFEIFVDEIYAHCSKLVNKWSTKEFGDKQGAEASVELEIKFSPNILFPMGTTMLFHRANFHGVWTDVGDGVK